MASASTLSMATHQGPLLPTSSFLAPSPPRAAFHVSPRPCPAARTRADLRVKASAKEKAVTGLTAAALAAYMVAPEVAEATVSPSLKNFLLSIGSGGVVAVGIIGAVVAVSNFDPVKRT